MELTETGISWMYLTVLAKKQDLSLSLKTEGVRKTRQVTKEQEDAEEKEERKGQLLLQGKKIVQGLP